MLHKMRWLSFLLFTGVIALVLPSQINADADDGYYEIDYEVLNADNDSVSVANYYFDKLAVLVVDGDYSIVTLFLTIIQYNKEYKRQLMRRIQTKYKKQILAMLQLIQQQTIMQQTTKNHELMQEPGWSLFY